MEKVNELKEALCDVRKAHRIIYSYQARMLDLVRFISAKLDLGGNLQGTKYYSNDIWKPRKDAYLNMPDGMWAWDFLYSYVFEYYLDELALDDGSNIAISIIQYSDTGYFENSGNSRVNINTFASEEESGSKLLFLIEMAPKKKDWVWDVEDIVNNKEYASINHTKTVLKKKGCVQGLYSFPIERFIDENSTLEALHEFVDFCKENDIAELDIV